MKYQFNTFKIITLTILIFATTAKIAATSCAPSTDLYRPIYMPIEEFRNAVKSQQPIELNNPKKILLHDHYLFVIEENKGIHVINNIDPQNPNNSSFINVPGVRDITSKDNILFADSLIDLVAIDISDPSSVLEVARLQNVYSSDVILQDGSWEEPLDHSKGVVVSKTFVGRSKCNNSYGATNNSGNFGCGGESHSIASAASPASDSFNSGKNGSTSKMIVVDDYLYLLSQDEIKTIHIANPNSPVIISTELLGWDIETIFSQDNNLYIGGQTGVKILDISNPTFPTYVSSYQHQWQCDPIVVSGNIGYVTLRRGSRCPGNESSLQVIDLTDIKNPLLLASYPLDNPYGLAIDNNLLFITNTTSGFMIFDALDSLNIQLKISFNIGSTYDVITQNSIAIIVGEKGIFQYDYQDINNVIKLSQIPVIE